MSKSKNPQKSKGYSAAMDSRHNRAAGVHKDQKRRACAKQLRRDRSYREDY